MPILRRMALMSVPPAIRSTPSMMIAPLVGSSSRLQQRNSVLLPEPDGPMMNTSSCGATTRSMPRRTSVCPKLLCRPRTWRIGGRSVFIASIALRRVLGRIVARHAGHAVAGEHGDGGGAGRRFHAEPFLVHPRNGAVELHALDGIFDLLAQLGGILAECRAPHQAGRVQIGQFELRIV